MQEKDFVSYEYMTKQVKANAQTKAIDMYEAFGFEATSTTNAINGNINISFRRNRKQKHKQELNKLLRQAEEMQNNIDKLNSAKTSTANIFAYTFGIIAALILGGGMSMVMTIKDNIPVMVGGIILGIIGIALCCANYFIYKKIVDKNTKKLLPVIDENEEKLANILEKGNDLLQAEQI